MEPCPQCGRAEMANVTHPCSPQITIFEEGVRAERARVVAWLRETGRYANPWHLGDAADCIERGEHVVADASPPLRPSK